MGYRLVAVSGKFGGNRRLPTGKVNPGAAAAPSSTVGGGTWGRGRVEVWRCGAHNQRKEEQY